MENKTLDYFMTQKASEISGCHPDELITSKVPSQDVLNWIDIADRYASHVAEQACRKQRELCADAASVELIPILDGGPLSVVHEIKDSILKAPLATEGKM